MKHMRWICALALIAALLLALPALAEEGTGIVDPIGEETSEATCPESDTGVHQIPDDAWVISVEPSCMVGLRKGRCTVCGMVYNEVIPANNVHVWDEGEVTTAPTCVDTGVKTYTCIMCGSETKTESIPATGEHTWDAGVDTTAPTCTTAGVKTFTCTVCDDTKTAENILSEAGF